MLRIGVKYCGGCNPEYDRVALVERIKKRLSGKISFVPPESHGVDIILAVQGCKTACADLSGFRGAKIRTVTNPEEGGGFVREILETETRINIKNGK